MNEAIGFALLAGLAIGFLFGIISCAKIAANVDNGRIKKGLLYHDGSVFKLTEIKP